MDDWDSDVALNTSTDCESSKRHEILLRCTLIKDDNLLGIHFTMHLSFDVFDVFAFLDRPTLDKAAYVCRRFDSVIKEKRMKSSCIRTLSQVLVEGESTTYNIKIWTAERGDGRSSLQFTRANFQEKLRTCLRGSVTNVVQLSGIGVNEEFVTMLARGLDEANQTKQVNLKDIVFPSLHTVKLLSS